MSGFKQGVSDITRAVIADVGDAYQAVLKGRPVPPTDLIGDMIYSADQPADIPQSYEAALREHHAMEAADHSASQDAMSYDAEQDVGASAPEPSQSEPDIGG